MDLNERKKKPGKGKEKKLLRKQELEREFAAKAVIDAAYAFSDQLVHVPLFRTYTKSGCDLELSFSRAADLSEEIRAWCLALTTTNMKELYEKTWGWDERKKRRELEDERALYVVAVEKQARRPIAFMHFRFLYDEDKEAEVLYLYEIQIEADYQSKGVGRFFMVILQLLGTKNKMKYVMMTVFKINTRAVHFYTHHLKYSVDSLSPSLADPEPHLILSKAIA